MKLTFHRPDGLFSIYNLHILGARRHFDHRGGYWDQAEDSSACNARAVLRLHVRP